MSYDEGYIKYQCEWTPSEPLPMSYLKQLNHWRQRMYKAGWIGYYEEMKVGYGNISRRHPDDKEQLIISGTQTGHLEQLDASHYSWVHQVNIEENSLKCKGPIKASSESLTHAAIYQIDPTCEAVIHIHSKEYWEKLMHRVPTTKKDVPYGTAEMAYEMWRLYRESNLAACKIVVMAGHEEGIISFGDSLEEAGEVLFQYLI